MSNNGNSGLSDSVISILIIGSLISLVCICVFAIAVIGFIYYSNNKQKNELIYAA